MSHGFQFFFGGSGDDGKASKAPLAKFICTLVGAACGAQAAFTPAVNDFLNSVAVLRDSPLPLRIVAGIAIGAAFGWFICHHILAGVVRGERAAENINVAAVSCYPRWITTLFPVALAAFVMGWVSVLYIWVAGLSVIALAGAYLIPFGMIGLYCLLGAAEQYAKQA